MRKLLLIFLLCSCLMAQPGRTQKPVMGQQINWGHHLSQGLVGYWLMNENPGPLAIVNDLSGNGNTGSLFADAHAIPGPFGPTIDFDGTGDYISTDFDFDGRTVFTIAGLFRRAAANAFVYVSESEPPAEAVAVQIGFYNNGVLYVGVDSTYVSVAHNTTNWAHIVFTYNGNTSDVGLHVDGIDQGVGPIAEGAVDATPGTFQIGRRERDAIYTNGQIDHVMIWDRVLTGDEALSLYANPFQMFERQDTSFFVAAAAAPAEGQVINVIMSSLPLVLILLLVGSFVALGKTK